MAAHQASEPMPAATGDFVHSSAMREHVVPESIPDASAIVEPPIERLQELQATPTSEEAHRRGSAHQQDQRQREQETRRHAAEVGIHLFGLGWAWTKIADLFQVAGRTLRQWCHDLLARFRPALPIGRPVIRSSREDRNEIIHFLDEFGPQIGVPTLRECFPNMKRAELEDLLKRYRRVWRERNREPLRVLHWTVVGSVWAIDYAESTMSVDGRLRSILAVRDLASGMQLLWQPVDAATGENAALALKTLFAMYGPPLVLKSDNGGHFTCPVVQDLLTAHRVKCLFSPPYWPRFNGGIEAGIGAMKGRTAARAARAGHAGYWTWDDMAGAFEESNTLSRPRGDSGPSPNDLWTGHSPIRDAQRIAFGQRVQQQLDAEKRASGSCVGDALDVWSKRAMARDAIRLALEECGYLHYTRRLIPPPIPGRKTAGIP